MFNNNSTNAYTPFPKGHISTSPSEFTTTVTLEKTANHTEISIMKYQWIMICKKISAIKIRTFSVNMYELIIGASIPYIIDIFKDYYNDLQPNFLPIIICGILLLITTICKKLFKCLNDNSAENCIHLSEIKEMIDDINNAQTNITN